MHFRRTVWPAAVIALAVFTIGALNTLGYGLTTLSRLQDTRPPNNPNPNAPKDPNAPGPKNPDTPNAPRQLF